MLELVHDSVPFAQIVIDEGGHVVLLNDRARTWFRLDARDVGRPLQDLEISYRPAELRSVIDRATVERRPMNLLNVERQVGDGELQHLDIHVVPLVEGERGVIGTSITFMDVSNFNRLQSDLERSRQELETAYEELQSTVEELQSSNEELESTNGELQTINGELRLRTNEIEDVNGFMESVLRSLQLGVVVVDSELRVRMWYGRSEDLWGLRPAEVLGQSLMSLDFGLPLDETRALVRASLAQPADVHTGMVRATNRRGRAIRCRIVASTLNFGGDGGKGVVLLMEELGPEATLPPA